MQNKGAIRFFAIAFALVCLFQLSFTFFAHYTESKARKYANDGQTVALAKELSGGDAAREIIILDSLKQERERYYLDSVSNLPAFNILVRKYTYKECKGHELNLGLDLKGGMNVIMEVSVADVIHAMSGYSTNPTYLKAMEIAHQKQVHSQKDFVTLFGESFQEIAPNDQLSAIFGRMELRDKIKPSSTNDEVLKVIRSECNSAYDRTFNILRNRIDRFGVTQPNIQKLTTTDRILIELPGIKEPDRVRKLLQGTAQLEFWETYRYSEVFKYLEDADKYLALLNSSKQDTIKKDTTAVAATGAKDQKEVTATTDTVKKSGLAEKLEGDTLKGEKKAKTLEESAKENPLFTFLFPEYYRYPQTQEAQEMVMKHSQVGFASLKDTARINKMLAQASKIFPKNLVLAWGVKPDERGFLELYALKTSGHEGEAAMGGDVITDARQDYGQNGGVEVSMSMSSEGAKIWRKLTGANVGKQIAIVLDGLVYSAPNVNNEIGNGQSVIQGNFSIEEGQDLANVLKAGKLPAPAKIVEEAVVGPTLGQEAINSGVWSFVVAFLLTLIYMILYYNRAGVVANVALLTNMFFVFGVLASLGAVLTLPGIAGIVLTIGMDVDKNVIIYERIREEIRAGKGIRLAISDGYKHALPSIIDGNVTTFLTGVVLYVFGSGPIQGFATTLIIGILCSMFCAIFITKLIFVWMMDTNREITVWHKWSKNIMTNVHYDFVKHRKTYYWISIASIIICLGSFFVRGVSKGIDFEGGRSYVVRFDQNVQTDDVRAALGKVFEKEPEVKIFGASNQVKITTSEMIDDKTTASDSIVEAKLYEGLKGLYKAAPAREEFLDANNKNELGKLSSQKVEPTIAYSLLVKAYYAVFFSLLIIFAYIAIRFRKWQWGFAGVISLFHDSLLIVGVFSLFYGILPFSLDIDQHFIAAILTIIGYSINDTVIIFDRVREYLKIYPKRPLEENLNAAINSTLTRTVNTSGITIMVLLSMFIFGGEVIRGFCFALIFGIAVGTYSSIFNATPIAYDLIKWQQRRAAKKKEQQVLVPAAK